MLQLFLFCYLFLINLILDIQTTTSQVLMYLITFLIKLINLRLGF